MSTEDEELLSSDYFEEGVLRKAVSCPIIRDRFTSLKTVSQAIRQEGVKECGLLFGHSGHPKEFKLILSKDNINKICLTYIHQAYGTDPVCGMNVIRLIPKHLKKNRLHDKQGLKSFGGKSLHDVSSPVFNPYQQIICIFGETLESFDDDGMIPVFGFGDGVTKGESVFSLKETGDCKGFDEVLTIYNKVTPTVKMSGPTNLAPLIKKAIEICKEAKKYHILVIAADGQISDEDKTKEVLVEASKFPLSIIMVGVGDGPWEVMKEFDDGLPERNFDNFQFVNFHEVMSSNARNPQAALTLHALMEIPDQYNAIKQLGII